MGKMPEALRLQQNLLNYAPLRECDINEAAALLEQQHVRIIGLDLESLRLHREAAELRLQLGQMTQQWKSQCGIAKQANAQLEAYLEASNPALPLPDAQIDAVAERMPSGLQGFLKEWGYRQFARKILALRAMPTWEPEFDCMTPKQEELTLQFCQEIAGERGKPGRAPDPVRLLEMAEALYKAERESQ